MLTIHRSPRALIASAAVLGALASAVVPAAASQAATAKGPVVSTATTSLGRILVDARGHTLYLFGKDKNGKSACSGRALPPGRR
jgi:predicted lipoprotein with Yx(FWY)xxD motif